MPVSGGKKKKSGGVKAKKGGGAGAKPKPAATVVGMNKFFQDMVDEWEETDERLAQLPEEDWAAKKEEMFEVTDRLYDIQQYPDEYKKDFIADFKESQFAPMMKGAKQIVKECTKRVLSEVDNRADALEEWKHCEEFLDRRRAAVKGAHKVTEEIEEGKAAAHLLEHQGLLLSNDEIVDQFDILERVLVKVRPLVDKADLNDYVTLRNMDEKFIQRSNKAIKQLQTMEYREWSHFEKEVDVLQECMVRFKKKFESKQEADDYIAEMEAALKVVKKHLKILKEAKEDEDSSGGKANKKDKKKAKKQPAKKGAEEGKKSSKKGGWLSRKFGR